ncbi:M23 family metallopeptidase [Pseudomonas oligotrophica]|uniref:M23 family metallopeptidase n=1 Tax=Pseudomonas oligotrophica TaxID=2912055 RepID=UPI001F2A45A9|nr:M23 family metallopeptidase [Pseudomonas oligotrophica]MCF7202488.1 M23 family metallopeptidase [Pseudomonas oligotrophica]
MQNTRHLFIAIALALGGAAVPAGAATGAVAKPIEVSEKRPATVRLLVNRAGGGKAMDVRNELDVPVEATLRLSRLVNVAGLRDGVIRKTVPPRSQLRIATLNKRQAGYPLMYRHSFSYGLIFSPDPARRLTGKAAGGYAYALPWRGGPFRISQGAGGDYSHNTPKGRYAVDIAMPVGTPIIAARAGTVLKVRDGQGGRFPDPAGNHVRIVHDDGTHGAYLHLQRGSVAVRPGMRVGKGELLGKSGNTGRSTGPHLHFVVQKEIGEGLVSIPFRFAQPVESLALNRD